MRTAEPHEIRWLEEQEAKAAANKALAEMARGERPEEILLSKKEAKMLRALDAGHRKGWMRNQPCPCGSGKKFKRCHW